MAVRKIRTGNDPILKKKCKTVPEVDDKAKRRKKRRCQKKRKKSQ